jgi:hypothetical protein
LKFGYLYEAACILQPTELVTAMRNIHAFKVYEGSVRAGKTIGSLIEWIRFCRTAPDGNLLMTDEGEDIYLGSVFPNHNLAWRNDFSYKGINLGVLFTARLGGVCYSATQANLDLYGVSEASAAARDAGGVLINGREMVDAIFPYVLMEGDLNLSYDSGSQKWTLHYEGFFVAPLGHKIKVIADYVGPMDGFTAL